MQEKIREAVEQALQSEQQQEIQTLTEHVEKISEKTESLIFWQFMTVLSFVIAIICIFSLVDLYSDVQKYREDFCDLKVSFTKLKRKKIGDKND